MGAKQSGEIRMARKLLAKGKSRAAAARLSGLTPGAITRDRESQKITAARGDAPSTRGGSEAGKARQAEIRKQVESALAFMAAAQQAGRPITKSEAARRAGLDYPYYITRYLKATQEARKYEKSQKLDTTL